MTVGIKGERIKDWRDWSAGIGYPLDDGQTPGLQYAEKLLGLRGELRVAPFKTTVTVDNVDTGQHYQYYLEEPVTAGQTPTFDAKAVDTDQAILGVTVVHAVAQQNNRLLYAFIASDDLPSAVVWSNTGNQETAAMTRLSFKRLNPAGSSGTQVISLWYLLDPTVRTGNINITWAASQTDTIVISSSWYLVDQSSPFGDRVNAAQDSDAGPCQDTVTSLSGEVVIAGGIVTDSVQTMTEVIAGGGAETDNQTIGDTRLASSWDDGAASVLMKWNLGAACDWAIIAVPLIGSSPGPSYLYAQRGKKSGSSSTVKVNKLSLAKDDFANLETGTHDLTPLTVPGQPVRYAASADTKAFWWFPMGDNQKARRLQTIGTGAVSNDTLDATGTALGADHFANQGNQAISLLQHSSNDDGGVRILSVDGDIGTEADWGPPFALGDRTIRSAGVSGLAALSWAITNEGLFSFTNKGRARLVFEDFRAWRGMFDNIPMVPLLGGMLIPHPTGLLWFTPGELPINVGMEAKGGQSSLPLVAAAELRGGRFMGTHAAGGFVWAIYQPDINSTSVLVLCAYPTANDPRDLTWQSVGTTTLADTQHLLGIFVTAQSKPVSALFNTPVAWFGDDDDLSYIVLDQRASPFRARGDTHKIVTSAQAYFSELVFAEPTDLTALVVTTDDMADGDYWTLSFITEGGKESNVGYARADGRTVMKVDRHSVHRLVVRAQFTGTSTADRVPPSIKRVELYATL